MRITNEMLVKANACSYHADIFTTNWPDGCEVNVENAQRAVALGLDLDWAAAHLLPKTARAAFEARMAPARATYDAARAAARSAYEAATATTWAAYNAAIAPARADFDAAEAAALADYDAAIAPARVAYKAAEAPAFVEACGIADDRGVRRDLGVGTRSKR